MVRFHLHPLVLYCVVQNYLHLMLIFYEPKDIYSKKEKIMDIEYRVCKKHGITEFTFSTYDNKWKCKKCSIDSVTKRRRELKHKLVEYKGGKCEKCGYNKCIGALEFHHINEDEKSFSFNHCCHTFVWRGDFKWLWRKQYSSERQHRSK